MIVVGITGGFASGKSEVARAFAATGAKTFDADEAARRALAKGKPAYRAVVKLFGPEFLKSDGSVDRKKLGSRVFSKPTDLKKLNILIHPGVILECLDVIERLKEKEGVLALDVPLLFESKMDEFADYTVAVTAPIRSVYERAAKRGVSRDLAKRILASQWSPERKAKLADFTIRNDGTRASLKARVKEVVRKIRISHQQRRS